MTKLKICGLKELDHALVAANAGADFLGFAFVPGVRRQLDVDKAREVIQRFRKLRDAAYPKLVGLFADQSADEVNRILRYCGLDMAQLCGVEPPEYWAEIEKPILKQLKVKDSGPRKEVVEQVTSQVEQVVSRGHICMLDKHEEGAKGGTGRTFDWEIAAEVAKRFSFMLAGGLTPENVASAIRTVHPWGVDVSSGVETDGVKDVNKIAAFARGVHTANKEESKRALHRS